jgi:hypothetical protein
MDRDGFERVRHNRFGAQQFATQTPQNKLGQKQSKVQSKIAPMQLSEMGMDKQTSLLRSMWRCNRRDRARPERAAATPLDATQRGARRRREGGARRAKRKAAIAIVPNLDGGGFFSQEWPFARGGGLLLSGDRCNSIIWSMPSANAPGHART